jgi:hypothetical protein
MPEFTWYTYLPGDGPGWNCGKTGDACPGEMHWSECPRIERSNRFCPVCFEEGRVSALKVDPEDPGLPHWCPTCDNYWPDVLDLDSEWADTVAEINERYREIRIPGHLPSHVHDDFGQQLAI